MATSNRFNQNDNRRTFSVDAVAEPYIAPIKKMLQLETATTEEIKAGVNMTENLVKNNKKITAHQVRNIYSLIVDLKTSKNPLKDLQLLRPKLAYIGARQKESDGKIIIKVIDSVIQSIDAAPGTVNDKINNLVYIMECIVAYQKFYSNN